MISGILAAFVALSPPLGEAAGHDEAKNTAAITVQRTDAAYSAISDQAAMVLVGTVLIGTAALRRAA